MWWQLLLALAGAAAGSIHDNAIGFPEPHAPRIEDSSLSGYNSLSAMPYTGGTYHFVSSTFPGTTEVDARGFHGGMFDGIGDFYPTWPSSYYKRFHKSSTEDALGGFRGGQRKKRSVDEKRDPKYDDDKENLQDGKSAAEKRARNGGRIVRGMEMGSSGFHGDVFNSGFGDFSTMKRGSYEPTKRSLRIFKAEDEPLKQIIQNLVRASKRRPEMDAMGFHGDTFGHGFGDFETMKKRRPEMDAMGFHGDVFGGGFGDFETMKKRRPEMDAMGFHGDTFGHGFGGFETMKKRRPEMDAMGFHGDTFGHGFGDFETMKKRRPEMDAMGFHGDTFGNGFGEFDTMKKRRPEMDAMGFHGDVFGGGFGDFETMKKRRPEMDAMGFHGDTFGNGFGEFDPMKKRRPEMDAMGFHGDVFGGGFGDFETMKKRSHSHVNSTGKKLEESSFAPESLFPENLEKQWMAFLAVPSTGNNKKPSFFRQRQQTKRRPEMDAMGFHGGVFSQGFGDFETMKRAVSSTPSRGY